MKLKGTILKFAIALVLPALILIWVVYDDPFPPSVIPTASNTEVPNAILQEIMTVAMELKVPWEIVFLPDGDMLITERPGTVTRIGEINAKYLIEGVEEVGEGGLLGMALHPNFKQNGWIYLYFTTKENGILSNRMERFRFDENGFSEPTVIIKDLPAGRYHNGGRIAFGPDGYLYVTTGDSGNSELAQDTNSLAGKILRLKDDGQIPDDNPFNNAVWTYGHRNPQGLAWDEQGHLWATEHGRSGVLSGYDELNLIEKGQNYGWPVIQGDETREGMRTPIVHSGPDTTWAPAEIAYLNHKLYFGGLRGESLYQADLTDDGRISSLVARLKGEYGRLRIVKVGSDGLLYIGTSNLDGRGDPQPGDDKIIKISPESLSYE